MSGTDFDVKRDELKVVMERILDAPLELVYKAFIDSELISGWWGPRDVTTLVDKNEVREGGVWRFICRRPNGKEDAFHGVYLKIEPQRFVSQTFNYEPIGPGHELIQSITLEEAGKGKTRIITVSEYNTQEDLDGMIASGMEKGASESYDRLAELLETLR